MRKVFLIIAIIVTAVTYGISSSCYYTDKEKIDLERENVEAKEHPPERSVYNIEAYIYRNSNILEFNLFNIGIASISVMNSSGELVFAQSVCTDMPVVLHCPLFSYTDSYLIEISSFRVNAIGYLNIY